MFLYKMTFKTLHAVIDLVDWKCVLVKFGELYVEMELL